jgi:O-antigen/teichoic acid export membrane protein
MIPFRPSFHFGELRGLLRDTLPFAIAVALSTLYFRVVIIIMSLIATGLQTGYFATSYRVTEVLSTLPGLVVATAFPILSRAARDDHARLGYALQRMFEMAVIGGLAMAVFIIIGADVAIQFIGGDEAAPAADVLRIQAVALPLLALTMTWGHGLLALRRHRDLLVVNATALVAVIVFALILIPPLEAEGAAIAVVLGELVLAGFAGLLLGRARGRLLESARVVPLVGIAAAATLAVGLIPDIPLAIRIALALVVYPALLLALRAVPSELLAAFRRGQGTR